MAIKLIKLFIYIYVISHYFALVYFYFDIMVEFVSDDSLLEQYIRAVYQSLVTTTALGYYQLDILGDHTLLIVMMGVMISGILFNSFMLRSIKILFAVAQPYKKFIAEREDDLGYCLMKRDKKGINLDPSVGDTIRNIRGYFEIYWLRNIRDTTKECIF